MKKLMLTVLFLLPVIALAKIPDPQAGSSVCYEGINKDKKIDKRLNKINIRLSRFKEYADTLNVTIDVVTKKGFKYGNAGTVNTNKTSSSISAQMDCDGGSFKLTQIDKDAKQVKLKIENLTLTSLKSDDCGSLYIQNKNLNDVIVLTRSVNCVHQEPQI